MVKTLLIVVFVTSNIFACLARDINFSKSMRQGYGLGTGTYVCKVDLVDNSLIFYGDITGRIKLPDKFKKHSSRVKTRRFVTAWIAVFSLSQPTPSKKMYHLSMLKASNSIMGKTTAEVKPSLLMKTPYLVDAWRFASKVCIESFRMILEFQLAEILKIKQPKLRKELETFIRHSIVFNAEVFPL